MSKLNEKKTREVQRLATRRRILIVAKELFISKSIRSVSMSEIAEKAEVGKGTVFHHYSNKEELLTEVLEDSFNIFIKIFKKLVNEVRKSPDQYELYFRKMIKDVFDYELNNPSAARLFLDYLAEFPTNPTEKDSRLGLTMTTVVDMTSKFEETFRLIGINKPGIRSNLFFSMFDFNFASTNLVE